MIEFDWPQIYQEKYRVKLEIVMRPSGHAAGWHTVERYFDTSEQARAFVEGANWYAQSMAETAFPKLKTTLIEPPK